MTFSHLSLDGDEGYPGDVVYNVTYSLSSQGGLGIKYALQSHQNCCETLLFRFEAMVTKATPVNLANHVYFNLAGHKTGAAGLRFKMKVRLSSVILLSRSK